jgi:DNA-binding NarL/FixJ family response regulator
MTDPMKVLLADDHPLMREALHQTLRRLDPGVRILDAQDYPSLFSLAARHPDADLALVDLNMPGLPGQEGIRQFRARFPGLPLAVLSASESVVDIRSALDAGALGYVLKSSPADGLVSALRQMLAGHVYTPRSGTPSSVAAGSTDGRLTPRQIEVMQLLRQGYPNKIIARKLDLTEGTVKVHMGAIFRALGVRNRTEAVLAMQSR